MRIKILLSTVFSFALMLIAAGASADPIGPICPNNTCQGSIYTLSYSGAAISSTATTQTFRIFLSIDTSGYTGGGTFLDDVAVKVVAPSHFDSASLFDAPGGAGLWTVHDTGITNGGCAGGGSGFVCADFTGPPAGVAVPHVGDYNWAFDITVDTGTLFTGLLESSIKARYVNADDVKVGALVSENISLQSCSRPPCTGQETPEPATLSLLAIALLGMGVAIRRRRS